MVCKHGITEEYCAYCNGSKLMPKIKTSLGSFDMVKEMKVRHGRFNKAVKWGGKCSGEVN